MFFNKFVEIGRVVFIAKGKNEHQLATIVDVLDNNKVLIDGPSTGVTRSVRNLKDLHLTKFKLKLRVGQRTKNVRKAFDDADIATSWQKSNWAQKLEKRKIVSLFEHFFYASEHSKLQRAGLNDFQRFKVTKIKQLRNRIISDEYGKLRKTAKAQ